MSDIRAENLLHEFGISRPQDIDLEAIAYVLGVSVRYEHLQGCEALIVGHGDRAIVRINSRSYPERQRFSLGHELGHWTYHKGRTLYCLQDDIEGNRQVAKQTEHTADYFAASLLMPSFLFRPTAAQAKMLSWKVIQELASTFRSSLLATILRAVDLNTAPIIFVKSRNGRREWFRRARDIDSSWFPKECPDHDSFAFDLAFDAQKRPMGARKIGADTWFDRRNADRLEIFEDSIRVGDSVYTILILEGREFAA